MGTKLRRWRSFEPRDVAGYRITMYGPATEARGGMLTFCESLRWMPPPAYERGRAVVMCTRDLVGHIEDLGHIPVVRPDPRDAFFTAFRALPYHEIVQDVRGDVAVTTVLGSRAFKVYQGRLLANHGGVYIGDGCTVGEHTCIDAGIYGEYTEIRKGTHIDNLVHIGHSAVIGPGCVIVAKVGIGGWAKIGANVQLKFNATIRDNVTVGDGAIVGMGATVVNDVPSRAIVYGCPAKIHGWVDEHKPED